MDDKRRTAGNDEDIDLSGMINEYSQDNELRKKIEELKKQKEWIPVKERLPERGEYVLASTEDGYTVCYHTGKEWVNAIYPIAWMPLPKPYKEAEG